MKFFNTIGSEISKAEFVRFYSGVYYYLNRDLELERTIDGILTNDDLEAKDVVDILRWKTGATKSSYEDNTVTNQWHTIDAGGLIKEIQGVKRVHEPVSETLRELMKHEYIGPVYAITLLYFLSKGRYPIYDKFAHIAIKMIEEELPFKSLVEDKTLEKEFSTGAVDAEKIFRSYQDKYIARLHNVFGDAYQKNRDIDRALWVYGHLFSDTKKNQQRIEKETH